MVAVPLVHDPLVSRRLLVRVWMTALGGAAKTWLWPNSPRFLSALTYVALGWSCLPYLPVLTAAVDSHVVILVRRAGGGSRMGAGMGPMPVALTMQSLQHAWCPDGARHARAPGTSRPACALCLMWISTQQQHAAPHEHSWCGTSCRLRPLSFAP